MSESKPRVYYAVWEDATLNDDDSVDESGFCSGAISTRGGGNLHWDENQFPVVHKDDYDAIKLENERLKLSIPSMVRRVTASGREEIVDVHALERERDRALAMLKRMAEALEVSLQNVDWPHARRVEHIGELLAEYRREFGGV